MVLRHEGSVSNVEIGARGHPLACQELGDLGSQRHLEALVGRMAIFGLAPNRHRTIHTEGREHKLLQVRALILAIARGHPEGKVLLLSTARHNWVSKYQAASTGASAITFATDFVDQLNG